MGSAGQEEMLRAAMELSMQPGSGPQRVLGFRV